MERAKAPLELMVSARNKKIYVKNNLQILIRITVPVSQVIIQVPQRQMTDCPRKKKIPRSVVGCWADLSTMTQSPCS